MKKTIFIGIAAMMFFSCGKNEADGIWFSEKSGERTWLTINHHQYSVKTETLPELEILIHKEGKIIYRNDSMQFVPTRFFDIQEKKWLLDYDTNRPVYLVRVTGNTLIFSNSDETLIYNRQSKQ
ncbi:MAG: hypothetical protein N2167_06005 [Flavobacteriales bacterium]|nr:hypothetical protein [Flavobacteriales bacterium]